VAVGGAARHSDVNIASAVTAKYIPDNPVVISETAQHWDVITAIEVAAGGPTALDDVAPHTRNHPIYGVPRMECNNEAARNSDADIASTITAKSVTDNLTAIDKAAQHPDRPTKEPPKPKCFRICGVLPD
jgi:hypothetical protein